MESRHFRLGFAGFGNVGQALARLMLARREELARRCGLTFEVTLLASARRGAWVEPSGISLERALRDGWSQALRLPEAIASAPIDLLFEATPLNPHSGEPALSHVRAALGRGVSVVTANKGPVAFGAHELFAAALAKGAGFRFESAVADCMPVFNLFEASVPVGRLLGFRGVLNSTSNHVLQAIARGEPAEAAVREMQRRGFAEADPSHDLDGWDQAVKAVIVANVLMGRDLRPADVERTPLSDVDPGWARDQARAGRAVRLLAEAAADGPARVRAAGLEAGDFLASLRGFSLGLTLDTELAGTINIGSVESGVEQTAYGMLADLVAIRRGRLLIPPPQA
ncbi:MAG TPA: homoserine dehydrogenase [Candidatus Polarisedimenticolia bacterium]|jgi:homoserine dehydrogenase|nr:homoserine dehydrogenase [Candidatus Polarisedimenticolia bacterium]